jgi:hypothetical protein
MDYIIQYAASDEVWKDFWSVPHGTDYDTIRFQVGRLMALRPQFQFRMVAPPQ